jgi:hypothetical protein
MTDITLDKPTILMQENQLKSWKSKEKIKELVGVS